MDRLEELQAWYASNADGLWEHRYGVRIVTTDGPAWNVTIDLAGTPLDEVAMEPIRIDHGDNDWLRCGIQDTQFIAVGDAGKLAAIIDRFLGLVHANSGQE